MCRVYQGGTGGIDSTGRQNMLIFNLGRERGGGYCMHMMLSSSSARPACIRAFEIRFFMMSSASVSFTGE